MVTRQQVYNTGTTRFAPARTSTVVQSYSNGGGYYGSGYYAAGLTAEAITAAVCYGSGSSVSIGIGSGYYGFLGMATAIRITTTATVAIHMATTATDLAITPAVMISSWKSSSVLRVPDTTTA